MLFEKYQSILNMKSLKRHIEYLHFRCKILLDLPVSSINRVHQNPSLLKPNDRHSELITASLADHTAGVSAP